MGALKVRGSGAPYVKRIQDGDVIVALMQQMANGWWGLYDTEDNRLTPGKLYASQKAALTAYVALATKETDHG